MKDEYFSGPSGFYYDAATGAVSIYSKSLGKYLNPLTGATNATPIGTAPYQMDYVELWKRFNTDFFDNSKNNKNAHSWLPNPVNETAPANKNSDMVQICAATKEKYVEVFTIGFETTVSSTAQLKKCASSHAHHFDVDGGTIDDAFAAIARDIQKLRLVN